MGLADLLRAGQSEIGGFFGLVPFKMLSAGHKSCAPVHTTGARSHCLAQRESSSIPLLDGLRARKLADRLGLRRMGTVPCSDRRSARG